MAQFRIDQVTPGAGTPGVSRHDLVVGEVITLTVTDPLPGAGVSYAWEILDAVGSPATLDSTSAQVVNIGSAAAIKAPCGFRVKLTATAGGVTTSDERVMTVRSASSALRPLLFGETAPPEATLSLHTADSSIDNAVYPDRSGLGVSEKNWKGWGEWPWEFLQAMEAIISGGTTASGITGQVVLGSSGEVVLGGFVLDGAKFAVRPIKFRLMGSLSVTGAGDGFLRLYDMGAVGAGPVAPVLRSTATILNADAGGVVVRDQVLSVVAAPGTNLDEIIDARHKYEVRAELVGGAGTDTLRVHNGGVTLEG